MDDLERCLSFIESLEEGSGNRIVPFTFGRAFLNTELPVVWDVNFLRVEKPGASWPEVAAAAERIQGEAGQGHRRIISREEFWSDDLTNEARRGGWTITPLVFMVRMREGQRVSQVPVRELEYAEMRTLREALARRQEWASSEDDVQQVMEANKRWAGRVDARFFAAEVDGKLAAGCDLYQQPGIAQVEDVETMEEYRNRGLASAVVLAAARAALEGEGRADDDPVVFLIADENDWPKVLYERMGFETVGRRITALKTNLDAKG